MSMFHAAALPKVQLRKRAIHLRQYFKSVRSMRWSAHVLDAYDSVGEVIDLLDGNPDRFDLEYAESVVTGIELAFPAAMTWRETVSEETIGFVSAIVTLGAALVALAVRWNSEPEHIVYAMPILVLDRSELMSVSQAKAA